VFTLNSPTWRRRALVIASTLAMMAVLTPAVEVQAEGSRSLYPSGTPACGTNTGGPPATGGGSCRANLEWRTSNYGTGPGALKRRTLFTVYLQAGEKLLAGSTAVGVDLGDVLVWNPGVIPNTHAGRNADTLPAASSSCSANRTANPGQPNMGKITSRAQELAGPRSIDGTGNTTGYEPCVFTAGSAGLYNVAFIGPIGMNDNGNGDIAGDSALADAKNFTSAQRSSIAAWDITVRSSSTSSVTNIAGRVFTYAYVAFTGGNAKPINQTLYITTSDGYVYETDTRGIDPNGFALYGNQIGFYDSDGTSPLNRNVLGFNAQLNTGLEGNTVFAAPQYPISFSRLASETLTAISTPTTPTAPVVSTITFAGNIFSNTSKYGNGGTFSYTSNIGGNYEIIISRDGVNFDPNLPANKVLRGVRGPGAQSVTWSGKDNSDQPFPVGNGYTYKANLHAGEYHFPLIDAESGTRGTPSMRLLNPPAGVCPFGATAPACTRAFFDDRGYTTVGGVQVQTPGALMCGIGHSPNIAAVTGNGFDSASTYRWFGQNEDAGANTNTQCTGAFGDVKGLDTWTYFPSNDITGTLNVVAAPDSYQTPAEETINVSAPGVLVNDGGITPRVAGVTGNAGTQTIANTVGASATTTTTHGTVTMYRDGSFSYTPNNGFSGNDPFTYQFTDDSNPGVTTTVNVAMLVTPKARNDSGITPFETPLVRNAANGVLPNDIGVNKRVSQVTGSGAPLPVANDGSTVTFPTAHGTVAIKNDGSYTYTPAAGWTGPDSFTYQVTADGGTASATVDLWTGPKANPDLYSTPVNVPKVVAAPGVRANDAWSGTITLAKTTDPSNGSVTQNNDGSFTYTPNLDFTGTDSYTYTITDSRGLSSTTTVTITISPLAVDDGIFNMDVNTSYTGTGTGVLANDVGVNKSVTQVTGSGAPSAITGGGSATVTTAHGSVTQNADGTFVYTPNTGYSGPDSYTYQLTANGGTGTATVRLNVRPKAIDDGVYTTPHNVTLNVPALTGMLANDLGTGLTVTSNTAPSHGTVTANADGSFTYVPTNNYVGPDSFTYTITDSSGQTSTATVRLDVTNRPPVANPNETTTPSNTPVTVPVLGNDTEPDGDPRTVESVTGGAPGSAVTTNGTTVTYTPPFNFTGYDLVHYTINDGLGLTSTSWVRILVTADNLAKNDRMYTVSLGGATGPGSGPGKYDQIVQPGAVNLSTQQLVLTTRDGYVPQPGDTYDIFVAGSITGMFSVVYGQAWEQGANRIYFDTQLLPDRIRVVASRSIPLDSLNDAPDAVADSTCATAAGECTLRAAIQQANATAGADTIVLMPSQTYNLAVAGAGEDAAETGDLDITGPTTVVGAKSTVNANGIDGVFDVRTGGTLRVTSLTITGGSNPSAAGGVTLAGGTSASLIDTTFINNSGGLAGNLYAGSGATTSILRGKLTGGSSTGSGGAITQVGGSLTIEGTIIDQNTAAASGGAVASTGSVAFTNSRVTNNSAKSGGAVLSSAPTSSVTATRTTFGSNQAIGTGPGEGSGGALSTAGPLTLTDVRITANQAAANGGGAVVALGATVVRVTFDANTAGAKGGGAWMSGAQPITVDSSTFSGNTAPDGAALHSQATSVALTSATITKNTVSGGGTAAVSVASGAARVITIKNTIVGDQVANSANCAGTAANFSSLDWNLVSDSSCGLTGVHDQQNLNANLGILKNNGGYSPTHLPNAGSPAINSGDRLCTGMDQRSFPRPRGGRCDRGAVEI
jgi:hypothetical protein